MAGVGDAAQEAGHFDDDAALWRIFFEENRDGIVVLHIDGSVFCANDRFAAMLGYTRAEAEELHVWGWDSQFERSHIEAMLQSVGPSGDYFETRHRRKDGQDVEIEITTNAALHNGAKLIFCNFRDITDRKRDRERIRQLTTADSLTGIFNRAEFIRRLTEEMARAARFNRSLALMMYDLDHFKRVNDTFGHDAGDEVLKTTVGLANKAIRREDIHSRWGGEEFMVLLPEADREAAVQSAEWVRPAIADHSFKHPEQVTTSFGVTTLSPGDLSDVLIKRADDALYQAKRSGRNRVEVR